MKRWNAPESPNRTTSERHIRELWILKAAAWALRPDDLCALLEQHLNLFRLLIETAGEQPHDKTMKGQRNLRIVFLHVV